MLNTVPRKHAQIKYYCPYKLATVSGSSDEGLAMLE
jgi:hypothetical protein